MKSAIFKVKFVKVCVTDFIDYFHINTGSLGIPTKLKILVDIIIYQHAYVFSRIVDFVNISLKRHTKTGKK